MQDLIARLGTSALLVLVAFGTGFVHWPYMRPASVGLFYVAVAAASWFYGRFGGAVAATLSMILIAYNMAMPVHTMRVDRSGMWLLLEFMVVSVAIIGAVSSRKRALDVAVHEAGRLRVAESQLRTEEDRWRALAESVPSLIWTCRADGSIDYVSPQWKSYTGASAANQVGYRWLMSIHPNDRGVVCGKWESATAAQSTFEAICRIRAASGIYRWFKMRAVPVVTGGEVHWVGTCTDVDDIEEVERNFSEPLQSNS
jgi:PAS domain S-box-containing protein